MGDGACISIAQEAALARARIKAIDPTLDLEAERGRLSKELEGLMRRIVGSEERLSGSFAEKAPAHIVERERDKLAEMKAEAEQVREQISRLAKSGLLAG